MGPSRVLCGSSAGCLPVSRRFSVPAKQAAGHFVALVWVLDACSTGVVDY